MYYQRYIETEIKRSLKNNPVTAIIGPRQCGKSTTIKKLFSEDPSNKLYLDLERPSDQKKLEEAEWFLSKQKGKIICLDEIQRKPEIFPLLRSLTDEWGGTGHFIILGSATRELLNQSSESLAGRISYKKLTPFIISEINQYHSLEEYLEKGGFPRSLLAPDKISSIEWRQDFITTFLERDLLLWSGFSPTTMRRLWQMLAYSNGQFINYSTLGKSLGVSNVTIKNYIDLLSETYMVNILPPFVSNMKKRLVKTPKVYISDSGIANALINITDFNQLLSHPTLGATWEGLVLNNLKAYFPLFNFYFYRTTNGAEIDLIAEYGNKLIAIECKVSVSPTLSKGFYNTIEDIRPVKSFVVCPVDKGWPIKQDIEVVSLFELVEKIKQYIY